MKEMELNKKICIIDDIDIWNIYTYRLGGGIAGCASGY